MPLKPDQHSDGVSLLPLLKGEQTAERALIWHYPHYGNQDGDPSSIIRRGDWKLIYYYEDDHEELYNLKTDLSETTDIAAQNPEIAKKLHDGLLDYLDKVGGKFPQKDPEYKIQAKSSRSKTLLTSFGHDWKNSEKKCCRRNSDQTKNGGEVRSQRIKSEIKEMNQKQNLLFFWMNKH